LETPDSQPDARSRTGFSHGRSGMVGIFGSIGIERESLAQALRNIGASPRNESAAAQFAKRYGHSCRFWALPAKFWHLEPADRVTRMLDRIDYEPLFFAPFVSSVMTVEEGWIDYNGHLNMAYYNVLFDRAADEALALLGCGIDYVKTRQHSCFTAEVHVRYLRELHAHDPVRVTFQLLDYDAKRMHTFEQLFHAEEGWVSATSENMSLHVDMAAKKTAPFPPEVAHCLARMREAHAKLPVPEAAGRKIAMPARS
jgi:acyl-CoA thioester hydrolase